MFRVGAECGYGWPTDVDMCEILRNDPRASGTVYGTHYATRFTDMEMLSTPVLSGEAPLANAQVELREHNPFASRSTITSTATLTTQGQAECDVDGDPPPASGSLLKGPRSARTGVVLEQINSLTDPQESPMKEQSKATLGRTQVGETKANLCLRNKSV